MVFGQYTILQINHAADWIYICQCKQAQKEKDVTQKNLLESITITDLEIK